MLVIDYSLIKLLIMLSSLMVLMSTILLYLA